VRSAIEKRMMATRSVAWIMKLLVMQVQSQNNFERGEENVMLKFLVPKRMHCLRGRTFALILS
jgi:hypothetical protein